MRVPRQAAISALPNSLPKSGGGFASPGNEGNEGNELVARRAPVS